MRRLGTGSDLSGYVIKNREGEYLNASLLWVWRLSEAEIFIFDELPVIRELARGAAIAPETILPARRAAGEVSITPGDPRKFYEVIE